VTRVDPRTARNADPGTSGPGPTAQQAAPSSPHAGVVTRVLAACVDGTVVVLLALALDLGAAGVRFAWSPLTFRWPQPGFAVTALVFLALAVLYLTVPWATTGRTYGARLLGLRVRSTGQTRLGWIRALFRALACVVLPVGLLWSGVSTRRRSVQDLVFRSVVVYDLDPRVHREAGGGTASRAG
jgi:uncharacterized RDD family membrane protein YckC